MTPVTKKVTRCFKCLKVVRVSRHHLVPRRDIVLMKQINGCKFQYPHNKIPLCGTCHDDYESRVKGRTFATLGMLPTSLIGLWTQHFKEWLRGSAEH